MSPLQATRQHFARGGVQNPAPAAPPPGTAEVATSGTSHSGGRCASPPPRPHPGRFGLGMPPLPPGYTPLGLSRSFHHCRPSGSLPSQGKGSAPTSSCCTTRFAQLLPASPAFPAGPPPNQSRFNAFEDRPPRRTEATFFQSGQWQF